MRPQQVPYLEIPLRGLQKLVKKHGSLNPTVTLHGVAQEELRYCSRPLEPLSLNYFCVVKLIVGKNVRAVLLPVREP